MEDGILFVNQNILLNDVFDIYFSGKTELKESTRSNYKYMYDKFVRMKFGMRKISLIKYSDIREFYNYLINDLSFKPNSLEIIHSLLHPTFTLAVRDGYIRCNPSDGLKGDIKKKPLLGEATKACTDRGRTGSICSVCFNLADL